MGLMLFDSTFFVDLDRDKRRGREGAAIQFLRNNRQAEMAMSMISLGELARGFDHREQWSALCRGFLILALDEDVLWTAAQIFNQLRKDGALIADNDLWIAATAMKHDIPLVTDNLKHFGRIEGLRIENYRELAE
jgi:predicted nucleic acid-binding protein